MPQTALIALDLPGEDLGHESRVVPLAKQSLRSRDCNLMKTVLGLG